jgi:hypothetical protein
VADDLASWAARRAPELLARAESEAVAALRDALIDAAVAERRTRVQLGESGRLARAQAAPAERTESGDALWAYCVLHAEADPPPPDVRGVAGGKLERVVVGDLAAIVSRVPLAEFGAEPLRENLNDLGWLEKVARAHESVQGRALEHGTLVPLRLCTIYESEKGVREMLEREHDALTQALDALADREEWGAKLLVDGELLAEQARSQSAEAADLEEELSTRTGGGAYMLRRRLERHVRDAADSLAAELADQVHAQLQDRAIDATVLPPQNPELSGHAGQMLLNGAYLVDAGSVARFRELAAELEERHRAVGAKIELSGPWPPYNFVSGVGGLA